jgi:hypothetical protein
MQLSSLDWSARLFVQIVKRTLRPKRNNVSSMAVENTFVPASITHLDLAGGS